MPPRAISDPTPGTTIPLLPELGSPPQRHFESMAGLPTRMKSLAAAVALTLLLCLGSAAAWDSQWRPARATYYSAPGDSWSIHDGSCTHQYIWPDIYPGAPLGLHQVLPWECRRRPYHPRNRCHSCQQLPRRCMQSVALALRLKPQIAELVASIDVTCRLGCGRTR